MVVQHFWCRKICSIVCRVPREWVKPTLCQDAGVMSLAEKCIVVGCFVFWDYDKILTKTGKFSNSIRVTENGLVSGVDRVLKSSNSTSNNVGSRLDPLRKSVNFDVFFLCPPSGILFTCIHDNAKVLVPWIWDSFPVFWAPAQKSSQFSITYYIEITCHDIATWSIQILWIRAVARWGILGKTLKVELLQTCFVIEEFGSNRTGIAIGNAGRLLVLKVRRDFILDELLVQNVANSQSVHKCLYWRIRYTDRGLVLYWA